MTLFPFFEDIENKTFLVIGGGKVAAGKIKRLLQFTDNIIVIAEKTDIKGVEVRKKAFEDSDIFLGDYVIGATDSSELNSRIASLCKASDILVNVVDDPQNCTFIFPSLIKKGDLTIGISSAGKSPAFCKKMRKEIETMLPENTEEILDKMGQWREYLKEKEPCKKVRSEVLKSLLSLYLSGENVTRQTVMNLISEIKE